MNISYELAKIKANNPDKLQSRSLPKHEIEQLMAEGKITPPEQIPERSMGPRVSFPDRLNATTFGLRLMSRRIGQGA